MISRIGCRAVAMFIGCCLILAPAGIAQDQPAKAKEKAKPEGPGMPPPQGPRQWFAPPQPGGPQGPWMRGPGPGGMQDRFMGAPGLGPMRGPRLGKMQRRFMGAPGSRGMRRQMPDMPGFGPMGSPMQGPLSRPQIQKELGITDEQRKKMEDIRFGSMRSAIQSEADLRIHRLELMRLLKADSPDRAAIDKKIQDLSSAQTSLMRSRINSGLDVQNVLSKEQRDKMRQALQKQMRKEAQPAQPRPPAPPKPPAEKKL